MFGIPTVKRNVQSYLVNILLWKTTKRWNSKLPAFWLCNIQPCIWFSGNYARLFIWQHGGGGEKRLPGDCICGGDQPPRCGHHQFSCGGEFFRGISEISSLISLLPTFSTAHKIGPLGNHISSGRVLSKYDSIEANAWLVLHQLSNDILVIPVNPS